MGKLLLPDFAMTKSSLPRTNLKSITADTNSDMDALWFSDCSHYSHHHSISEPPIYKLILALYYDCIHIIENLLYIKNRYISGCDIPYIIFAQVNSTDKDQRKYFNYLRNRMPAKKANCSYGIEKILLLAGSLLLFCKSSGSNSLFLVLFGLIVAFSYCAELKKIGANLRIILIK